MECGTVPHLSRKRNLLTLADSFANIANGDFLRLPNLLKCDRRLCDRGASLFGAKGGAFRAAAGALIVATLNNGGNLLAVNAFYLQIIIGALILAAGRT